MQADLITRILSALEREGVRYTVFGAIALNALGLARGTHYLDLFVAAGPDNVARLREALESVFGGDPSIDEITSEDLSGPYPAIQYVPPEGTLSIDILSRLGDAFSFEDLDTVRTTWAGVPITVVSPRQLYEMKRDTVRWKDRMDAERLERHFGLED